MLALIKGDTYHGGYTPAQVELRRTLTIGQLIEELTAVAESDGSGFDAPVIIQTDDRGYNSMAITGAALYEPDDDD